jgi:poly-gamma-glutamate synthesis protein (capsule biosynthesis protein)
MKSILAFILSLFTSATLISPQTRLFIPTISPAPTVSPQATVGFVGDLGLGRHITSTARAKNDFSWSFQGISPWLLANDFTLANLESPIITDCPKVETGTFVFCGDPKFLPYLKSNKFTFNLNNNHILNYGLDGLNQTKSYLSSASIPAFSDNFLIQTVNGLKFGFLGYDFITYPKLDKTQILSQVKALKPQVDFLIVSLHWGNEYLPKPEQWRIDFAHQLIDAGTDVIHGQHPHVWQGLEIYKGKYIFYSLGNFIFDQSWSYDTSHSQIARLTFTKTQIIDYKLFPIEIKFNSQPWLTK